LEFEKHQLYNNYGRNISAEEMTCAKALLWELNLQCPSSKRIR
jgi:hypothetical protein